MTNTPSRKQVRKAVFPVAGLGTRFLPATKVMPKEMLTVGDRPLIQHVVEEARSAGIEEFIFVTSPSKKILEQHFESQPILEKTLNARGKHDLLQAVLESTLPEGSIQIAYQDEPLGLGHAIWCAKDLIGNEPFAILLPDVLINSTPECLAEMNALYQERGGNVIAIEDVAKDKTDQYGIVDTGGDMGDIAPVKALVEKPKPAVAPSTMSVVGRYILQPEVFEYLSAFEKGAGGEIQLTDAMAKLIGRQPFHTYRFKGKSYDCGHRLGFIEANLAYGLNDQTIKQNVQDIIKRYEEQQT
jgi:UTP--glucose-1-phosphate uridylyltransferase